MAFTEDAAKAKMRSRIVSILTTPACADIHFRLANIYIGKFMFNYVAQIVKDKRIVINFDDSPSYDPGTRVLTVEEDAHPATIVHESTHILINACHVGQVINKGHHESAAYVAESLWALNVGRDNHIENDHIRIKAMRLAKKISDYNPRNPGSSYLCDMADVIALVTELDRASYTTTDSYVQTSPYAG